MLTYTSCTTTEIDETHAYAEVKVLRHEGLRYDPVAMLPQRMSELKTVCADYVRLCSPFSPTGLAEWITARLPDVREVGVFNADGSGVIVSVESDHSI